MLQEEHEEGKEEGRQEGREGIIFQLVEEHVITLEKGAEILNLPPEEFRKKMQEKL